MVDFIITGISIYVFASLTLCVSGSIELEEMRERNKKEENSRIERKISRNRGILFIIAVSAIIAFSVLIIGLSVISK